VLLLVGKQNGLREYRFIFSHGFVGSSLQPDEPSTYWSYWMLKNVNAVMFLEWNHIIYLGIASRILGKFLIKVVVASWRSFKKPYLLAAGMKWYFSNDTPRMIRQRIYGVDYIWVSRIECIWHVKWVAW
jgi:hypothetical protein